MCIKRGKLQICFFRVLRMRANVTILIRPRSLKLKEALLPRTRGLSTVRQRVSTTLMWYHRHQSSLTRQVWPLTHFFLFPFCIWAWAYILGLNWTPNLDCVLAKKTRLTNVKKVKPNKIVYLVTRPKQNNIVNKASTKTGLPYEIISPTIRLLKEALLLRVKMLLVIIGSWWINLKRNWRRKQQPLIKLCHQLLLYHPRPLAR